MSADATSTDSLMHKLLRDRFDAIRPLVAAGDVLDVGCVDARPTREGSSQRIDRKPNQLFRRITEENPGTLGLDIDAEGCTRLRELGYNVECGDAQAIDLGRRFDTIVAGELIEHLENPGAFLRNMRRHLKPGGTLVVSTPNPFAAQSIWKICRHRQPAVHEEHTCWFDPITLVQLMQRTGFEPETGYWLEPQGFRLRAAPRLFRSYFAHSFMLVAKPAA